ncbi:MAG: transposase [Anaerolinea sp.]|nr:transposase [Anaerolinea sp.]
MPHKPKNNAGLNASASLSPAKAATPGEDTSSPIAEAITPAIHQHTPPHVYLDDTWYIITASTYQQAHYLASDQARILVRDKIQELIQEFKIILKAWVILNNHYHLLLKTHNGYALPRFFQRLHGGTSFTINGLEGKRGRKVWYNYWDTCIRDERGFWTRFNYIHTNPIKHGYVKNLNDWPYSSYHYYLRIKGEEWLTDLLRTYPVLNYLEGDDF